mgnify:CR=1 FL=1
MAGVTISNLSCLDKTKPTMNLIRLGDGVYQSLKTWLCYYQELIDIIISDKNANVAIWDSREDYDRFFRKENSNEPQ